MHRRACMKLMGSAIVAWHAPLIVAADQVRPKLIWVLLRGGMDSLHALLPLGDSQFARQRKSLVKAVEGGALDFSRICPASCLAGNAWALSEQSDAGGSCHRYRE